MNATDEKRFQKAFSRRYTLVIASDNGDRDETFDTRKAAFRIFKKVIQDDATQTALLFDNTKHETRQLMAEYDREDQY